jgi:hypothetical protein
MSYIVPNAIELDYLETLLPDSPDYTIGLFRVNDTPLNTWTPSLILGNNYEASFAGYSRKTISWPNSPASVSGQAETTSAPIVWQMTAPTPFNNFIYGYFIFLTRSSTTYLIGADKFTTPIAMTATGAKIEFALKAILKSKG